MLRGLLGIATLLAIAYALSFDRKRIDWKLVGGGLLIQLVLALAILHLPVISHLLEGCGKIFVKVMDFTGEGLTFLLGPYASKANGYSFLLHSLPVVIFFSALVSICYYWGIIQRIVGAIAWCLRKFMNISGAEGLVSAGNIFLGMTESRFIIRHCLPTMAHSALLWVMVAGMGTLAWAVMGSYISLLGGTDPAQKVLFATHLLSASIMAVPGSIVIAKMLCPQTEQVHDLPGSQMDNRQAKSLLEAITNGTAIGVKLMTNIAALLLVFISLVALANYFTEGVIGRYTGLNDWIVEVTDGKASGLTFQFILGVITAPFMWLIGVPSSDIMLVGSLLGQKTILNEFVAYFQLQQWKEAGLFLYDKSIIMSTYILCGFANISSIGMLLGGLGVLAPEKKDLIARLGVPAMIGGALVSLLSATLIGMIID